MKYIDVKTVVESYKGFQDCMTNKSWGYLALLKGCNDSICPLVPYEVNMDVVSNFLEGIFNLSQAKRQYDGGRSLYVVFSNKWEHYFNDQGRYSPNIYDVAVWAYRRKAFPDDITEEEVINDFAKEFNMPFSIIKESFNTQRKIISFTNTLYSEATLKSELGRIGVDVSRNNIDAKKGGVVASPGEISRGPFVQTLYAGLDITDYVLILQSNYSTLYGNSTSNTLQDKVTSSTSSLYRPFITAIKSKPFLLLAGISGTGKSRIVRELAFMTCPKELQDEDGTTPGNYCMIEVKPNWHDSTELLGYYSSFNGGGYRFTKFDRFVVKAWLNPKVPFFVCLDEMNLAPVEQYFAEFLSVLETRSRDKRGDVVTGALVDKQYFKDDTKMTTEFGLDKGDEWTIKVRSDLVNKGLTLPPNLIVIGTVNMDDTTYQFSRKVIDRAMTIEMNGGELNQMFGNSNSLKYRSDEDVVKLGMFKAPYINADEVIECYQSQAQIIKEKLPEKLEAVNTALKDTPFQVSYRVLNELVIYLGALMDEATAKGEAIDDDALPALIDQAMDKITLMKILPRIEGDEDMFRRSGGTNVLKTLQALFSEDTDSYRKLEEMADRLNRTGFTRFWP
ncbi:MAG: ATPase [Prevotella sp.]|nr:ATPase [Prevotella sp.]